MRVDEAVRAAMDAAGQATCWVVMPEGADLSGAAQISDWAARGEFVYQRA